MSRKVMVALVGISLFLMVMSPAAAQDTAPATTTLAEETTPQPLTASTDFFATSLFLANVRSGPGTQYTILGKLKIGDSVDVTGRSSATSEWLRVIFDGQDGWIFSQLVKVTGQLETAPVVQPGETAVLRKTSAQLNAEAREEVIVITRFNSRLRSSYSLASEVLLTIPHSTQLKAEARSSNDAWIRVTYEEQTGWVSAGLLSFVHGNIDTLPVIKGETAPVSTETSTSS